MATVSDLTAWRDRLMAARFSGTREVHDSNGESVTYKSDQEMANAMQAITREIEAVSGTAVHTILFSTSKGLN